MTTAPMYPLCCYDVGMTTTQTQQDSTSVRLPRSLVEQLRPIAAAHDRSLAAELRVALTAYVQQEGR